MFMIVAQVNGETAITYIQQWELNCNFVITNLPHAVNVIILDLDNFVVSFSYCSMIYLDFSSLLFLCTLKELSIAPVVSAVHTGCEGILSFAESDLGQHLILVLCLKHIEIS